MGALLPILIQQILIPEIAALIRNNPGITDAEIIARLGSLADRIVATGEAYLAAKGAGSPTP